MKQPLIIIFVFLFFFSSYSQEENKHFSFEADYFYGNIYEHSPDISHLIKGHPTGLILAFNKKTFGFKEWERQYNSPDWGFSFIYQDMKEPFLGENYALYSHFNFYFLKRYLMLTVGTGMSYNTNPYDSEINFEGNAYGSSLLSSTFLRFNYVRNNIWKGLGFHAGLMFVHYSNGNYKAPNTSTNTIALNTGLSYQLDYKDVTAYNKEKDGLDYSERIKYNFVLRFGVNESDVIGLGKHPFYAISAFADKRLNYKSSLQVGADLFVSYFLKDFIKYRSIAYPEDGLMGDEDYKRIGVFIGHELRFNKVAFVSQIGYYVYWPYEFETRIYLRAGVKRYFYKDKIFGSVTLKSHYAQAEAFEFGIGIRL
jgi:hypothetical protein